MSAHSIDAQIVQSLPLLGKEEKSSLLKVIQSFLMLKNTTVAEPEFDLDEYNREIDEAEAESERDGFISHEDMKAEFAQWKQERIK